MKPRSGLFGTPTQARGGSLSSSVIRCRELVAHLAAVDDHVDRAVLQQELGALEAFGQRFAHGLLDHARPGETDQRARLGDDHVADHREARRHAAHGRIGQHRDERQPLCGQAASAHAQVFAICMSESTPSCMRAPPVAVKQTKGRRCSRQTCTPRTKRSPTTEPIEPPRKPNSNAAATTGSVLMLPCMTTSASSSEVSLRASCRRSV